VVTLTGNLDLLGARFLAGLAAVFLARWHHAAAWHVRTLVLHTCLCRCRTHSVLLQRSKTVDCLSLLIRRKFGIRDAREVPFGEKQRLLVRSVEVRTVNGTAEIRYEHTPTVQI
jgi:hypothetical protein